MHYFRRVWAAVLSLTFVYMTYLLGLYTVANHEQADAQVMESDSESVKGDDMGVKASLNRKNMAVIPKLNIIITRSRRATGRLS